MAAYCIKFFFTVLGIVILIAYLCSIMKFCSIQEANLQPFSISNCPCYGVEYIPMLILEICDELCDLKGRF